MVGGNRIAVIEQRAPFDEMGKQWVPYAPTYFRGSFYPVFL